MDNYTDDTQEIVRVKTKEETDKKCPCCAGTMDFDPATGGLLCPYCGHKQEIDAVEKIITAKELDFNEATLTENCNWGVQKKTVICKACGAQSIYDALDVANECPYCGSNQVMEANDEKTMAPGGVCPFKIDKAKTGDLFTGWIKKRWFCPREAKQKAKPDAFKGMYIPYWTFDTQTSSEYTARYGIDHTERDSKGNTHIETDWYRTSGHYDEFINDQLVLGSDRQDEKLFSKIEPFNTEDNVEYKPEYIAGFIAERYSVGLKSAWEKAKAFIKRHLHKTIENKIENEHNADRVSDLNVETVYNAITYKYLMLPVWISSFQYKNKTYQFLINGQTGKVGGKTPISALRVALVVVLGLAIVGLIYYFGYNR